MVAAGGGRKARTAVGAHPAGEGVVLSLERAVDLFVGELRGRHRCGVIAVRVSRVRRRSPRAGPGRRGSTSGAKRPTIVPSRPIRNFSKFQRTSPGCFADRYRFSAGCAAMQFAIERMAAVSATEILANIGKVTP